jgi:hypothetical protein
MHGWSGGLAESVAVAMQRMHGCKSIVPAISAATAGQLIMFMQLLRSPFWLQSLQSIL